MFDERTVDEIVAFFSHHHHRDHRDRFIDTKRLRAIFNDIICLAQRLRSNSVEKCHHHLDHHSKRSKMMLEDDNFESNNHLTLDENENPDDDDEDGDDENSVVIILDENNPNMNSREDYDVFVEDGIQKKIPISFETNKFISENVVLCKHRWQFWFWKSDQHYRRWDLGLQTLAKSFVGHQRLRFILDHLLPVDQSLQVIIIFLSDRSVQSGKITATETVEVGRLISIAIVWIPIVTIVFGDLCANFFSIIIAQCVSIR
ncbi:hypothetical protein SSS_07267 [Sarcoptes scabiei]|uniref:Uncharacterized protein n=1 Tax=Sarcoptes scabiei TaxID=52283 RepID=A0A834V8Z2_SARSC|nr:hypothetical protein SSS_07267 [Sarcoptes scabiei]